MEIRMVNAKTSIILLLLVLFSNTALAQPDLPMEIYGNARSFNTLVPPGTTITAFNLQGEPCGEFVVKNTGFFGTLSCLAKNTTEEVSGANPNELIRFRVGNFPASVLLGTTAETLGNLYWESGEFKEIILVAPPLVCGDGFCDYYESCVTCPEDCGECLTQDPGQPGDLAAPQPPDFQFPQPIAPEPETPLIEDCEELWECSDWGPCRPEGIQTRTCIEVNDCQTEEEKPETERECVYEEPIRPPTEETNITERPRTEAPQLIETCNETLPILGVESLIFLLIITLLVLAPLTYLKKKKKEIKKKKIKETDKLVKIYVLEHKIYSFIITASVLSLIVYLYHFFFLLCPEVYYKNLWLLVVFVLLSPIIIMILLQLLKYSERKKQIMIKLLNDTHYAHLKYLLKIINEEIIKSEAEITNRIYSLNNKEEFTDVLVETKEIKKIYDDLLKIYSLYVDSKDSTKIEKDLLEQIQNLEKNKEFIKATQDHPELASLKDNILLLNESYESKKELNDKIKELELKYEENKNSENKKTSEENSEKE